MSVPELRPTSSAPILDEIHRLVRVRDDLLSTLHALEVEVDEETARRVNHRVASGQSVAAAERAVAPEVADTRRRLLHTRISIDRATHLIEHYRFLHANL